MTVNADRVGKAILLGALKNSAKALPGLPQTDSRVGTNTTSRVTARQQITPIPVVAQTAHAYAHTTDVCRKQLSRYSSIANAARENEHCK
eukprot:6483488-Ditylum_brightwellii.AAC.1